DLVRQFANLERYCCMIVAFFDFEARFMKLQAFNAAPIVDPHLMGCFTTSPSVASALYYVRIPVWLMQATNSLNAADIVVSHDRLELPSGIETSNGLYSTSPIYVGSPGLAQFKAIAYHANLYIDIESKPFPLSYGYTPVEDTPRGQTVTTLSLSTSSQAGTSRNSRSTPSSSSSSSQAGPSRNPRPNARNQPCNGPAEVDKFSDPPCPFIQPLLPPWKAALAHAGKVTTDLTSAVWGFWTPEPAHVVGTASEPRRHRYVLNWLRIREGWLYSIRSLRHRSPMYARWWRAYLDDGFNLNTVVHKTKAKDHSRVMDALAKIFQSDAICTAELKPAWFGSIVTSVDDDLCRSVAWELSELGFRVELLMLDLHLFRPDQSQSAQAVQRADLMNRVFQTGHMLYLTSLPSSDIGLCSPNVAERAKSLDALRLLMQCWPNVPEMLKTIGSLENATEEALHSIEPIIAQFYCKTFVKYSGRAPSFLVDAFFPRLRDL
ncbi:hypothetical protein BC835DRAFT_1288485, partial [Cytidiella melzeri]